jgi:hypothetical protein
MIKPLLEGFDPARRPLLFYVEFWPVAPVRDGAGSIVQIWQGASGSAICAHFANRRKQLRRSALAAIAGVLRVVYPDTPLTMPFLRCPRCHEELRRRSPRQRVLPR